MEETTKMEYYVKYGDLNIMGRREEMKVYRKSEASLCSNCCNGKAISITSSECMSVALVT
jgi:hypothetical protein